MMPLRRWLREPLVHFLLAGLALFVVYALTPGGRRSAESKRIEFTTNDLRRLEIGWAATWQRSPTAAQFQGLIEEEVRQEILYREALAFGLDKGDTIVKRRLAQKMEFLTDDVAAMREPGAEELKAWFLKNRDRFALPPRASFRHIYFSFDQRNDRTRGDAASALASLAGETSEASANGRLGDRFMFQEYFGDRTPEQVAQVFGKAFATALFTLRPGSWQGPVESGYGWHLVWIDSLTLSGAPVFDEVESAVKDEWLAEQRTEARRRFYEALKARYEIVLPSIVAAKATSADATQIAGKQ